MVENALLKAYDRIKSRMDYSIGNRVESFMSIAKDMTSEEVSQARQILNARIRDIELEGEPNHPGEDLGDDIVENKRQRTP